MSTITIDVLNKKVLNILNDLEALDLIKILKKDEAPSSEGGTSVKSKPSDYKGSISPEVGEKILEYVTKSRKEW